MLQFTLQQKKYKVKVTDKKKFYESKAINVIQIQEKLHEEIRLKKKLDLEIQNTKRVYDKIIEEVSEEPPQSEREDPYC